MFFFGTRGRTIRGPKVTNVSCPSCGRAEHTSTGVQKYFHLYWIPLFPTKGEVTLTCTHCRFVQDGKDLQPAINRELRGEILTLGRKLPLFVGLLIIAGLIAMGINMDKKDRERYATYLENPSVGDFIVADMTEILDGVDSIYPRVVLKVVDVGADSVECLIGGMGYQHTTRAERAIREHDVDADDYFTEYRASFSRDELLEMRQADVITAVERGGGD